MGLSFIQYFLIVKQSSVKQNRAQNKKRESERKALPFSLAHYITEYLIMSRII